MVEANKLLRVPKPGAFPLILTLDTNGIPHRWITWQHACFYYAKDQIAWTAGEHAFTVFGGHNRISGTRSRIVAADILRTESGKATFCATVICGNSE